MTISFFSLFYALLIICDMKNKLFPVTGWTIGMQFTIYDNHNLVLKTFSKKGNNDFALFLDIKVCLRYHSSEIRGLCLMKWPSEMLQNLPYFWIKKANWITKTNWNNKTNVCSFFPNECPGLCQQGHPLLKIQSCLKWKMVFRVFFIQKYGKFWSISEELLIKSLKSVIKSLC